MDKKNNKIFRSLFDPNIAEFVDWNKFLSSQQFAEISQDVANHFIESGDYSHIKKILDQVRASQFFKPTLLWFCNSAGLEFSFMGDELALKRAEGFSIKEGGLKSFITRYAGTAKNVSEEQMLDVVISQEEDAPGTPVVNNSKNARRNEVVRCSACGVELARKKLKQHKRNAHTLLQNQDSRKNILKTASPKATIRKIKGELRSDVEKLKDVPLEYQASVYAKIEREKRAQQDIKRREHLENLKSTVKKLNEELSKTVAASVRVELERKILACNKAIKSAPKPKRKWSPILSGSFESGK